MLSFLSTARLQEFGNDGRLLNGGKIYSYALGTTTPKATYQDINGEAANTNPVILDSVGSASIYLNGSYTFWLFDENDVQLGSPVDILGGLNDYITSGGSGQFADNIAISIDNYDSVRSLSNPYSFIFVQGRETQADGGQGIFYLDQSSSESDDDGVTLAPDTTGRYIRLAVTEIDPRWFGAVYGSASEQVAYLEKSETASIRYSAPVKINGSLYINQNHSVAQYAEYIFTDDSKLVSTLSVDFTFVEGSKLLSCGRRVFGNSVQPIFETGTVPFLSYSIIDADNNEGRLAKLLASSTAAFQLKFDEAFSTSVAPQIPSNFELIPGEVVTITAQSDLSFFTNYTGYQQLFAYSSFANVGNVSVSGSTCRPEWFGSNDNISFKAAAKTGKMKIADRPYLVTSAFATNDLIMVGDPELSVSTTASITLSANESVEFISNTNTFLKNVTLLMTSNATIDTSVFGAEGCSISASAGAINTAFVNVESSVINNRNIFTGAAETDTYYSNVQDLADEYKRFYQGFSAFRDIYLLNEISEFEQFTNFLTTDQYGKVYSTRFPNIDALSATQITVDRLDVRFNYETLIEFRWRNVVGTPYCEVFRNGILQYDLPNPLTATYTASNVDEKNIVVNITGTAIGTSQITLTSANSGISSRFHDVNILSLTTNSFLVGGDLVGGVFLLPNSFISGKTGINAQYYYTAKKWFLI